MKRKPEITAKTITNGERLLIDRRRYGLSQREAAEAWGVTLYLFRCWERDKSDPPFISVRSLKPFEVCLLMRRRARIKLSDLADELGISRWWLTQMERGEAPDNILVSHWGV